MKQTDNSVPKHIGVIMDGSRRFAKRLMLKPWKGHEWGARKVEQLFDWCKEIGIKELTLYALSVENFNRPREEFDFLMDIFRKEFDAYLNDPRIETNGIRINVIGRIWMLPQDIQDKLKRIMGKTKHHTDHIVNFALAYGGRSEVVDAAKKIAEQVQQGALNIDQINEETFAQSLYMQDEPDIIIRTGGDHRTSNFLIWQSSYTEWMFIEKMWPEFEKEDFLACIDEFKKRERRFGK